MRMNNKMILMLSLFFWGAASMNAQVTIGENTNPHSGAVLDLKSTTQGLHLPNVALKADLTDFVLPLTGSNTKTDAKGMVVYNTANVGQGPGIYAWDGAKWFLVGSGSSNPCTSVTDIDGNVYPAKLFGTQCWMTKNLRVSRSYAGAALGAVKINPGYYGVAGANTATSVRWNGRTVVYTRASAAVNTTNNATFKENGIELSLDYDSFANEFGFLYTFTQAQEACPVGWHLPNDAEYTALVTTLGPNAGKRMKANDLDYVGRDGYSDSRYTLNWGGFAPDHSDNSGFNALPAGQVLGNGTTADSFSYYTGFWTSTKDGGGLGVGRALGYNQTTLGSSPSASSTYAFSVRCLRD